MRLYLKYLQNVSHETEFVFKPILKCLSKVLSEPISAKLAKLMANEISCEMFFKAVSAMHKKWSFPLRIC